MPLQVILFLKSRTSLAFQASCYLMGGANDFLLKVMVRDLNHYHEFSSGKLAAIPNVREIKSTFVLNTVKHSTKLPIY